jgi:hypothetical protein
MLVKPGLNASEAFHRLALIEGQKENEEKKPCRKRREEDTNVENGQNVG